MHSNRMNDLFIKELVDMVKDNNEVKISSGAKWLITTSICIATIIVSIALAWGDQKGDIKLLSNKVEDCSTLTTKDVAEIKTEGCTPSKENTTSVAVIKSRLTGIEKEIGDLKTEQKNNTAAIIRAIKKED